MSVRHRFLLVTILAVLSTGPIRGQGPSLGTLSDALLHDAASYAESFGVDLDEAVRRLRLQKKIGDLDADLSHREADSFAGLWIEHQPEFRVVVRFTDPFAEKRLSLSLLLARSPVADLVEVRPAEWSLAELKEAQAIVRHLASQLEVPVDTEVNVFENRVEVYTVETEVLIASLAAAKLRLPSGVEIMTVDRLAQPTLPAMNGGIALSDCTGGFTVRASNGELGISTAAHCSNTQSHQGTTLPFRSQDQQGNQDVQWNSACDLFDVSNQFNSGIGLRSCTGTRHRNNQAIGTYLCKWGKTSGRTCGTIQSKNLSVWWVTSSASTFIRVDGDASGVDQSQPGDSGAPWFVETLAYGINIGEIGTYDAIYMAINYISSIGVSVLTSDPGVCNLVPNAYYDWSNPSGLRVDFDASGSSDPDGSIVSYFWDFDDGSTQTTTSPTVTHWYSNEASYFVSLRVTDNEGKTDTYFDAVLLCEGVEFCEE